MDNINTEVKSGGSKKMFVSAGVLVIAVLAIGGYMYFGKAKTDTQVVTTVETVAKVNGVDITKEAFETQLAATITSLKTQGVADADSAEKLPILRTQVLNDLINNELVNQGIKTAGITATSAEIETQYQALVTQLGGADKMKAEMDKAGLTETTLRENIAKQVTVQKYLAANINVASIVVTDAEIKKFYDDNTQGQTNVPKLKDVSEQIKQQLTLQKQQTLISAFLDSLRSKAQVETTLK